MRAEQAALSKSGHFPFRHDPNVPRSSCLDVKTAAPTTTYVAMARELIDNDTADAESGNTGETPLLQLPEKSLPSDGPSPAFRKCLGQAHDSLDRCECKTLG